MTPFDAPALRVLLVEDEPFIRDTIRRLLRTIGAPDVREAKDGTEALEVLRHGFEADLIFCDVRMAPMDGLTFLKTVRRDADPALAATPVIVLTASADIGVVRRFSELGISSYLLKPVSRAQLLRHMSAATRRGTVGAPT